MKRYYKSGLTHHCGYEILSDSIDKINVCPNCRVVVKP